MWTRPPFTQLASFAALFEQPWDSALAELNARAATSLPAGLGFVEQDQALSADGLSYEQRIGERGLIAMRRNSLHDLYGAVMWLQWPHTKWAIHRGQMDGIRAVGAKQRTRTQQALTHLDEAGTVVATADPSLLALLQDHAWHALLIDRRHDWSQADVWVIGHALFELRHCRPFDLQASKTIAVQVHDSGWRVAGAAERLMRLDRCVAAAIDHGLAGADPKDQSTLPLAAIPGWDARNADAAFIDSAPCFRPRPTGRIYAPPIELPTTTATASSNGAARGAASASAGRDR